MDHTNTRASLMVNTGLGFIAILLWSLSVALARSLSGEIGTVTTAFLVYTGGGLMGLVTFLHEGRVRERMREFRPAYLILCGSLFVLCLCSFYLALGFSGNHLEALTVGLINYLWPTLILVFSIPLLKTRARPLLVPALLIVTLGEALAIFQGQTIEWAVFWNSITSARLPFGLALIAALTWGLYSNCIRRFGSGAGNGAVPFFMLTAGLSMGVYRLFVTESFQFTARAVMELGGLILSTNFGYLFWDRAMRKGNMLLVVSVSYFVPLLSTVFACAYLGIAMSAQILLAAAFLVAGALLAKMSIRAPGESEAR
jgi:drug/metabolite transporter (DMT)-like permease